MLGGHCPQGLYENLFEWRPPIAAYALNEQEADTYLAADSLHAAPVFLQRYAQSVLTANERAWARGLSSTCVAGGVVGKLSGSGRRAAPRRAR